MIDCNYIQDKLAIKYDSHKYMLFNSYVFMWECDFFSTLASGYCQEIEIKVSRGDFLADFKKVEKHKILDASFKGKQSIVRPLSTYYMVKIPEYKNVLDEKGRRVYNDVGHGYKQVATGNFNWAKIHKSTWKALYKDFENYPFETNISIDSIICPNKFYYACPENLINKEEVPKYAGLIYVSEKEGVKVIKNAPLLHKRKEFLYKALLDKFYYRSLNLERELNQCKNQRF